MVKLDDLKACILEFPSNVINMSDILNTFWYDTSELKELAGTLEDWKERRRIKTTLRYRVERVRLAFNQLFLEGAVKNQEGLTFTKMRGRAIRNCKESIKTTRQMVQGGEGGIMTRCWLGNLLDYLKSYKHTEILKKAEMNPLLKQVYKPKGQLICVGSSLVQEVYPTRIIKLREETPR